MAESIWFGFCYRSNIFKSKILDLLLPLGKKRAGGHKLDITKKKFFQKFKNLAEKLNVAKVLNNIIATTLEKTSDVFRLFERMV